jgi:hypothetical protein
VRLAGSEKYAREKSCTSVPQPAPMSASTVAARSRRASVLSEVREDIRGDVRQRRVFDADGTRFRDDVEPARRRGLRDGRLEAVRRTLGRGRYSAVFGDSLARDGLPFGRGVEIVRDTSVAGFFQERPSVAPIGRYTRPVLMTLTRTGVSSAATTLRPAPRTAQNRRSEANRDVRFMGRLS